MAKKNTTEIVNNKPINVEQHIQDCLQALDNITGVTITPEMKKNMKINLQKILRMEFSETEPQLEFLIAKYFTTK